MTSVLQDWVQNLSFMQQSVLLSCVRGPDGITKEHPAKRLLRWYRRCILLSAFDKKALTNPYSPGGGSFTGPSVVLEESSDNWEPYMSTGVVEPVFTTVDSLPHHFVLHLIHAAEIIGYMHPNLRIRRFWNLLYLRFVTSFHMNPETKEQMMERLGDNESNWIKHDKTIRGKND